jgi:ABC-2 type transport system permease protein
MTSALSAEWIKVRTLPGTGWLLLGAVAVTVAVSAAAAMSCTSSAACHPDITQLSLTGADVGQAVIAVRDAATAIGIVLGLLYLVPVLGLAVTSPGWHRHLQQIAPMTAGLEIQASTGLGHLPISPWAGLGVLAAWATAALLVGGLLLRFRDA